MSPIFQLPSKIFGGKRWNLSSKHCAPNSIQAGEISRGSFIGQQLGFSCFQSDARARVLLSHTGESLVGNDTVFCASGSLCGDEVWFKGCFGRQVAAAPARVH
ncbi:Uncharacterized protein Adt_08799 [Abeliophyllum distichum]|uniref:Uncharacterized protein n=1 Tax=Abeliophyllum distichum TaxID=126358 RepID=A0ABD1UGR1_9LAMI